MNQTKASCEGIDCVRCRRWLLTVAPGPRVVSAESAPAQAHLQACAACRAYADETLDWRRLGGRLCGGMTAPADVRQRVFRELALARTRWLRGERPRQPRGWQVAALGLFAALLVIVGARLWPVSSTGIDVAAAVVEDHWRDLHRQHIDSTDPAVVQRWLSQRLPIPVRVAALPGAALRDARLCFLRNRLGAVLRYRVDGAMVSYYIMPAVAGDAAADRDRSAIQQESEQGYNVVLWRERGLLHALVGDLPRSRLLILAAACQANGRPRAAVHSQAG
ncbi:MAG: hypothetical protein KGJ55_05720 [Gammaproteobacteria bacterium]|nr:hypothetical protein [Gammaproteobacteria bacterium]